MSNVVILLSIIGALGTWTATVATLVYWLSNKFAALERCMLKQMSEHIINNEASFHSVSTRVQRLELKEFGFTVSGTNGGMEL